MQVRGAEPEKGTRGNLMERKWWIAVAVGLAMAAPAWCRAEDAAPPATLKATADKSEEELAKQAQNPIADAYSFPFQDNIGLGYGPNNAVQNVLNFQPVIPIHLGPVNVITRTIVPIISQPTLAPGGSGGTSGLGDITFTAFLSPRDSGAVLWGVGPVATFPSATSPLLGSQSTWGLGPSAVVLTMPGHWMFGVLVNNVWSVAGAKANNFLLQYFVIYFLPEGWSVAMAPIITADWNLPSNERWLVPFGAGVGKLVRFGKVPVNFLAQAYYNAIHPDHMPYPSWTVRLVADLML
jgi:hypothetical protein